MPGDLSRHASPLGSGPRLGGRHLPPGLSSGEKVRMVFMVIATLALLAVLVLLLTGRLDETLSFFTPSAPTEETPPPPDQEPQDGPATRPDTQEGGLAEMWPELAQMGEGRPGRPQIRWLAEDPGEEDDEAWKQTENYKRYRTYITLLTSLSDKELAARVDPDVAVFSHVWPEPEAHQGEVIRLRGILVRRVRKHDQPEDLPPGVEVKWEAQIFNYGSRHIYTLDLIGDCPAELMNRPVTIDAIFFDVIEYRARANIIRRSCFFIGRTIRPHSFEDPTSLWMLAVLIIPVLAVLVFALLEARKLRRFQQEHLRLRSRREYERRKARARAEPQEGNEPAEEQGARGEG